EDFVNFLAASWSGFFDFIFFVASRSINGIDAFLVWLPWWLFILIIFGLGWYFQSLISGVVFGLFIFLIGTFGLWTDMMTTIAIILIVLVLLLFIILYIGLFILFYIFIYNII